MQKNTYMQKPAEVKRAWHLIDASGKVLGQVATEIAVLLAGKQKTTFTPNVDGGDFVVLVNAAKVVVTSNKQQRKLYFRHSLFPGGITEQTFEELLKKKPAEVIQRAVINMLPKNKLRADRMARLKVYADANHKHESQVQGAQK